MKQKTLSILTSTVPNNLQPVVLKNWLKSTLNINVGFEHFDLWKKEEIQRTSNECYYFKKSEMRWYKELQATSSDISFS